MFSADRNHLSQCFFCKLLIISVTLVAHPTTAAIESSAGVSEPSTGVSPPGWQKILFRH